MKILVTGINGFLGSHLAQFWTAAGHTIAGTTRRDSTQPSLSEFDAIVHTAYDRQGGVESNVSSTKAIYTTARQAGVPYQIFISSYAARAETQAIYGRMKYQLETFFLAGGHAIVRPGLVIGNGGMFGRNLAKMLNSPLIPLLDGGRDLIPVIAIRDLIEAMNLLLERRSVGAFNLFNPELVSMRTLIDTINRAARRHPLVLNVPSNLALIFLTLAEKLRIPFPAGADNVRSLKQSLPHVYQSDLESLIRHPCSLEDMVKSAVRIELRRGDNE